MSKIIIENNSDAKDDEALMFVSFVMRKGKVSNFGKSYCYCTVIMSRYVVWLIENKKSIRFVVEDKDND